MAVFRIEKTRDYTVMSNHHLRNAGLSLKSKGLLSMMLSLPEDWNYQEALKRKAEIESQKSSNSFRPPIRILRSSCPTSSPSTAKSGGACPCMTAKLADRQLHQPHHRGHEGAGHHHAGGG